MTKLLISGIIQSNLKKKHLQKMVSIEDFLPDFGRYLLFVSFLFYVESSPGLVLELRVHLLHHHCWPTTIMICPEISGVFDMVCPCLPNIIQNSWPSEVQAYRILGHPDVCAATSVVT